MYLRTGKFNSSTAQLATISLTSMHSICHESYAHHTHMPSYPQHRSTQPHTHARTIEAISGIMLSVLCEQIFIYPLHFFLDMNIITMGLG